MELTITDIRVEKPDVKTFSLEAADGTALGIRQGSFLLFLYVPVPKR